MIWFYRLLVPALWLIFLAYWWWRSQGVKDAVRVEADAFRMARILMFWVAIALLSYPLPVTFLRYELWQQSDLSFWGGTLVTLLGLLFSVWARQHLAGNWSATVTIKEDHELITSGPYRLTRHPIYTGLLIGFLGTMVVIGEVRGLVALVLVTTALWLKMRLEERWMREQFGEHYEAYSRRTAALIPGLL
jgi:protein-S-isoprenylcysteine O-methyltransferase Ste14